MKIPSLFANPRTRSVVRNFPILACDRSHTKNLLVSKTPAAHLLNTTGDDGREDDRRETGRIESAGSILSDKRDRYYIVRGKAYRNGCRFLVDAAGRNAS